MINEQVIRSCSSSPYFASLDSFSAAACYLVLDVTGVYSSPVASRSGVASRRLEISDRHVAAHASFQALDHDLTLAAESLSLARRDCGWVCRLILSVTCARGSKSKGRDDMQVLLQFWSLILRILFVIFTTTEFPVHTS